MLTLGGRQYSGHGNHVSYPTGIPISAANKLTGVRGFKEILYESITLAESATKVTSTFKSNALIVKAMSVYTHKKLCIYLY